MLRNWLKIAFTNYKKNWLSTVINLFGLAIGLTGFMLILMHWNDEYSYESQNLDKDRTYFVETYIGKEWGYWSVSYPRMRVPKEQIPEIEDYVLVNTWSGNFTLEYGGKKMQAKTFDGSSNILTFFPFGHVAGNFSEALKDTKNIALSDVTAKVLFGSDAKNVIGKTITIEGKDYVVSAVYKNPEYNTVIKPGCIVLSSHLKGNYDAWGNYNWSGFFKLKKGADFDIVQEKINKIIYHYTTEIPAKEEGLSVQDYLNKGGGDEEVGKLVLTPLQKMKFDAKGAGIEKADKKTIYILLTLSILVVILSAINFVNLTTAQTSRRAKEVGVRKVLGSSRSRLTLQFLLEAFILCATAYLLSLILTELLLPSYNKFLNKEMKMDDGHIYLYSLLMVLLVSFISGIIPAMYLSGFKPINVLKGNFSRGNSGIWLRNGILTLQLVISSFFIIGSLIIYAQVNHMMNKDLGFSGDQAVIVFFNQKTDYPNKKYELLKQELQKIQGIVDITYSKQTIGGGNAGSSNVNYKKEDKSIIATHGSVDINFFKFYGIKTVAGRNFDQKMAMDTLQNVIVNESFVKSMKWTPKEALGKKVQPGFDDESSIYNIVGVVKDFNLKTVAADVEPSLYFYYGRNWNKTQINNIQIKLDGIDIDATLRRVKTFWESKAEPGHSIRYEFINKRFAKTFDQYKKQQILFTILNIIVLTIALLGLFALSSLIIDQKLKDVAIKKTLGASDKMLIKDLTKKFLWMTLVAVLVSIPFSYYFMNEWLKDFAYRIEMPWWPYILSFIILLLLTFLVVSIKAYRATKVELVKYLKYE